MGCVTPTRCPINVCRVTCVSREGLAAILSSLPSQLGPQRCPVTFSNGSPRLGCVYPLPFIPLALTKAFVLGFRLSRAWTSRRWAMSQSGTFVLFLLACLMFGAGIWKGVERGCTCRRVTAFPATSQCSTKRRGPGTGSEAWVVPPVVLPWCKSTLGQAWRWASA